MASSQVEKKGTLKKGVKMVYATSEVTLQNSPQLCGRYYGASIHAMSGPGYDPESPMPRSNPPDDPADMEQKIREDFDVRQMTGEIVPPSVKNLPVGSPSTKMSKSSNSRRSAQPSFKSSEALVARDRHLAVSSCIDPVARRRNRR